MISTQIVLALSLVTVLADEVDNSYQQYYQTNDLQGYSHEQAVSHAQDPSNVQAALALLSERQDFNDPIMVSGAIGVGNLVATGLAWANNRAEIDSLRTRIEKLESLLKTTCNKVNDVGTAADLLTGESTTDNTNQGAILTRLAAVTNVASCTL